jgi:hypothetical protein
MDDEKRDGPRGPKRGGGWMTHGKHGKGGKGDDMTGDGPTRVKVRVAERDEAAHEPLIRAPRSWPSKNCIRDSGPPPPPSA